jgi:DNA-binding CsgD family transcriptional regulator
MSGRLEAGRDSGRALTRARELEHRAAVDAYESPATWLGWWLLANDELEDARRLLDDQLHAAVEDGDDWNQTFLYWPLTELECRAGRYDAARDHAEAGLELAEQGDNLYALSVLQHCSALVAAHVGDGETARSRAEESLANARATHSVLFTVRPRITLGLLAVSEGRYEDALVHLDGLTELGLEGPYWATYPFWGDLFETLVSVGDVDRALAVLADLDRHGHVDERPGTAPVLARCRGLVQAASGSLEDAAVSFEEALHLGRACPVPLERGRSLLALGEARRRTRSRRAAREALNEALAIFESLGAMPWAERARKELARVGGRAISHDGLTPSEERVAALVAEGKANKEVAADLVVSVHTVEAALTSIYRKLGVRSRTEMARELRRREAIKQ